MPDNDDTDTNSDIDPTTAGVVSLLGHEIRAEIIQVLGGTEGWTNSFGELRSRLDRDVQPSQLHYHLQQLVGHLVTKSENGYYLNSAGARLFLALRSGSFDRQHERVEVDAKFDCHNCQSSVEAIFDNGWFEIRCSDCGEDFAGDLIDFPLEAYGDEPVAMFHFRRYRTIENFFIARSICPICAYPLSRAFHSGEGHPYKVCIHQSCDICTRVWNLSVGRALLADPDVIVFCYDHGIDILSTPHWELEFAATDKHVTVRSTDPWEVALEVTFDDETLELVIDGDLNVVERNRFDASAVDESVLPDKTDCMEAIHRHRWADGVVCPHCDSSDTIKKGKTSKDAKRYKCHNCNNTFNDLTETIFGEHRLTLPEMFYVIQKMDDMPATQIARQLDRSYQSILDFVHEVQDARGEDAEFDLPTLED